MRTETNPTLIRPARLAGKTTCYPGVYNLPRLDRVGCDCPLPALYFASILDRIYLRNLNDDRCMTFARVRTPEWMDDPQLPVDQHEHALVGLGRLNRVSGVARPLFLHLMKFARQRAGHTLRVIDIASGGGEIPVQWARWAKRSGTPMRITTTDLSEFAVDKQTELAKRYDVDVHPIRRDVLTQGLPGAFDVATCSLFMHHLDDAQAKRLLHAMQSCANGILVCDLERSRLNLSMVWLGSRLLSRSKVVHHDAIASVRGAYTRKEFKRLAEDALARPVHCEGLFPARFVVCVDELTDPVTVPAFA